MIFHKCLPKHRMQQPLEQPFGARLLVQVLVASPCSKPLEQPLGARLVENVLVAAP